MQKCNNSPRLSDALGKPIDANLKWNAVFTELKRRQQKWTVEEYTSYACVRSLRLYLMRFKIFNDLQAFSFFPFLVRSLTIFHQNAATKKYTYTCKITMFVKLYFFSFWIGVSLCEHVFEKYTDRRLKWKLKYQETILFSSRKRKS